MGEYPKMPNFKYVHLKFRYLENEECKLSEILNISLFAIINLRILGCYINNIN